MDIEFKHKLQETKEWLKQEYLSIRTGQVNPALLDSVKVQNYGSLVPLNQVGTIGTEDAKTLRISVWDTSLIPVIEQAINDADLGVSLATDSSGLRAVFPELTAERREQLLKLSKSKLEDARITVRSIRDEAMKEIEKEGKEGSLSEDEVFTKKENIQDEIAKINKDLEVLFIAKEQELKI